VKHSQALPLEDDTVLLARLSQYIFSEHATTLTAAGVRRAGFQSTPAAQTSDLLFFLPRELIGIPSSDVIGDVIDDSPAADNDTTASQCDGAVHARGGGRANGIPWESQDNKENDPPTGRAPRGGRRSAQNQELEPPLPDTPAARMLQELGVTPSNIRRLAALPPDVVDSAIAHANQEPGIRKKVNWVIWALKAFQEQHIQHWRDAAPTHTDWREIAGQSDGYMRLGDDLEGLEHPEALPAAPPIETGTAPEMEGEIEPLVVGDVTVRLVDTLQEVTLPWQWSYLQQHIEGMVATYNGHSVHVLTTTEAARRAIETTFRSVFDHALRLLSTGIPPLLIVTCELRPTPRPVQAPASECPAWLDPALWQRLPAMVRIAVGSARVESGTLVWSNARLGQILEQHYADQVALVRDHARTLA
jgi:hypothetical protein